MAQQPPVGQVLLIHMVSRHNSPQWARSSSFTWFLDHTHWRTTVGRTSLDEWSARCKDHYLTSHTQDSQQTYVHAPCGIRTHNLSRLATTNALDCVATGIGKHKIMESFLTKWVDVIIEQDNSLPVTRKCSILFLPLRLFLCFYFRQPSNQDSVITDFKKVLLEEHSSQIPACSAVTTITWQITYFE